MGSARRFYGPWLIYAGMPAQVRWRLAWSITRTLAQGTWDEAAERAAQLSPLVWDLLLIAEGLAIARILLMACRRCGCTKRRACRGVAAGPRGSCAAPAPLSVRRNASRSALRPAPDSGSHR